MLITKAIEKYSMNGYSVIKVLTHSPHKREVGEGRFIVLHPLSNYKSKMYSYMFFRGFPETRKAL